MLFSILDFVPKSTPEDPDDADETDDILNPAEKLKTAVHSFLRKSANLVSEIFAKKGFWIVHTETSIYQNDRILEKTFFV